MYKVNSTKEAPEMTTITIIDAISNETICKDIEFWGATDALVNHFCDDRTPQEVYDACVACGDAISADEPTAEYEAFLGIEIEF